MNIVEWINQIRVYKTPWENFDESEHKTFNTYIINRWLSMRQELIEIVNMFQKYSIGLLKQKDIYKWYCSIIPKGKKFCKYVKNKMNSKHNPDLIKILCKHYEVSKQECIEYINLLDKNQLISLLTLHGIQNKEIKKLLKGKK